MNNPEQVIFPFIFTHRYRRPARLFGITPDNSAVTIENGSLVAHFGPWTLSTTVANIARASLTGPYKFLKTAGPARLSVSDRGITFASNDRLGVFLEFRDPVPGIEPLGLIKHPNLTVTVRDCAQMITLLEDLGQDG